jgi:hypothetical protein
LPSLARVNARRTAESACTAALFVHPYGKANGPLSQSTSARIATAGPLPEGKNGGPVKVKVVWVERVGLELDELLTGPRPYLYTSRADLQAQN